MKELIAFYRYIFKLSLPMFGKPWEELLVLLDVLLLNTDSPASAYPCLEENHRPSGGFQKKVPFVEEGDEAQNTIFMKFVTNNTLDYIVDQRLLSSIAQPRTSVFLRQVLSNMDG